MSKTAKAIYGLHLNEVTQIEDAYWRRVPGGWVVTEMYLDERTESLHRLHPVFVPFSLPERDAQWSAQAKKQLERQGSPAQTPPGPQEEREAASAPSEPTTTIIRPSKLNDDTSTDDNDGPGF